jgi:hypothetical protein
MSHGIPVVVSRIGALECLVEDTVDGLYFEPGNARDLAEKINRLWTDPQVCRRLGMAARKKAAHLWNAAPAGNACLERTSQRPGDAGPVVRQGRVARSGRFARRIREFRLMSRKYHILLVSSSGGVLLDLLALEPWWANHKTTWAAVKAKDTEAVLASRDVYWVHERNMDRPFGAVAGFFEALKLLRKIRPQLIVSAGSGAAIGFFLAAKILRIPSFWLETLNFIDTPAVTGRICSRLASEILVQRSSMLKAHPRAVVIGELY